MSRRWLIAGLVAVGAGAGGVALVRFGGTLEGAVVGKRAPDFRAVDPTTGDTVSLNQEYAGAVTLLNIWATWCIPCRTEMPDIESLYQAMGPKGLRVVAVSVDAGGAEPVRAFGQELQLTFDILHDPSGGINRSDQITGVPETFLIDRHGVIVRKLLGPQPWDSPTNRRIVAQLLAPDSG